MVYDCFANIVQVPITDFNLPILQLLASTAKEHKNYFFGSELKVSPSFSIATACRTAALAEQ